jgi:hypothetical protein
MWAARVSAVLTAFQEDVVTGLLEMVIGEHRHHRRGCP